MATAAGNLHYLLISKKIMRSDWKILLKTKTTPRLWRTTPGGEFGMVRLPGKLTTAAAYGHGIFPSSGGVAGLA